MRLSLGDIIHILALYEENYNIASQTRVLACPHLAFACFTYARKFHGGRLRPPHECLPRDGLPKRHYMADIYGARDLFEEILEEARLLLL